MGYSIAQSKIDQYYTELVEVREFLSRPETMGILLADPNVRTSYRADSLRGQLKRGKTAALAYLRVYSMAWEKSLFSSKYEEGPTSGQQERHPEMLAFCLVLLKERLLPQETKMERDSATSSDAQGQAGYTKEGNVYTYSGFMADVDPNASKRRSPGFILSMSDLKIGPAMLDGNNDE